MEATYQQLSLVTDNVSPKYKSFLWEATFEDGEILHFINSGQCVPDIKKGKGHPMRRVYKKAMKDCKNKTVLDCACGSGCGSDFLANGSKHVVGIELKEDIATYGSKRYGRSNLIIQQGDIQKLNYVNEFDTVLCVDTIEHVEDSALALKNLHAAVKPSGIIIITTPDREGTRAVNPYHTFEWNLQEFRENISWMGKTRIVKPWNRTMFARIKVSKRE